MKIIIVGAGRIGRNLAKSLSEEENEVYVIDCDSARAAKVSDKLDVKAIVGNGADPDTLEKAQVGESDLVLAVTTSDETNLVVCSLANLLGAKRRIARVRNTSLGKILETNGYSQFHINEMINPEMVAAEAVVKTVLTPGSSEAADFANGRLLLRGFDVTENSPLIGQRIVEFADEDFPWPFVIVAIVRDENVTIPKGDTVLQKDDHIYVLLPSGSLAEFLTFVNPEIKMPRKVIIYGATITGKQAAITLSETVKDVLLVEEDTEKAKQIAGEIEHVTVINGSAAEADILNECGIEAADAFVATSNNDHTNLVSSVLAKKLGAKTTVIMSQQPDYMSIINTLGIDAVINPQYLAVEQILMSARGKGISAISKLAECDAEAIEFTPEEGSPITKDLIKNIKFPKNTIVGALYNDKEVTLVKGDTQICCGQKVITFSQEAAAKKLQELFTSKK